MNNFDPTELEVALLPLADISAECFEMSWVLHEALTRAGYIVTGHSGYVQAAAGDIVAPHFWLSVDGYIVDFRLRMWLGDEDSVPHGIFKASDAAGFDYCGEAYAFSRLTDSELFDLSDGLLGVLPCSV
jgi:hypothetical protein